MNAVTPDPLTSDDLLDDDDTDGYSEGAEDFSIGIEMPVSMMAGGVHEQSSGNVTPIPTQGSDGSVKPNSVFRFWEVPLNNRLSTVL